MDREAEEEEEDEGGTAASCWCPCIVGDEAVISYVALEAPGWLNIHGAQAANIHSSLHLSVEQPYPVFKQVSQCACVRVCVYVCVCVCVGVCV